MRTCQDWSENAAQFVEAPVWGPWPFLVWNNSDLTVIRSWTLSPCPLNFNQPRQLPGRVFMNYNFNWQCWYIFYTFYFLRLHFVYSFSIYCLWTIAIRLNIQVIPTFQLCLSLQVRYHFFLWAVWSIGWFWKHNRQSGKQRSVVRFLKVNDWVIIATKYFPISENYLQPKIKWLALHENSEPNNDVLGIETDAEQTLPK